METEFQTVEADKEKSIPHCVTFYICKTVLPSTWKSHNNALYSFICFILSIVSVITLFISLGISYDIEGYPTHSSVTPGVWTSFIGILAASYSSYILYFNAILHFPDTPEEQQDATANRRKNRSYYLNVSFLVYLNICSFIIMICGMVMRPLCLWYFGGSIAWFIATFIACYRLIYTKYTYDSTQYQNNNNELASDPSERKCCRKCFDCCCLHCCCPITLMVMALLIVIQACFAANIPEIEGQLYEMEKDGYNYNLQAICKGTRSSANDFTILLLHGGGSNTLSMQPLQNELESGGYRSCSYTRPGFAWSDASPLPIGGDNFTVDEMMDLMENKVGEQAPFIVIGHSVGGQLAKTAAYRFSDKILGIVLLDSVPSTRWEIINGNISFDEVTQIYDSRKELADIVRFATPFGLLRPFTYDEGYAEYADKQWWAFNLDSEWQSQWAVMQEGSLHYKRDFDLENFYMEQGVLGNVSLLNIPAGLNATCEQKGYDENSDECEQYLETDAKFVKMQLDQTKTSLNGEMTICLYPCDHAFAWTESEWIFETIEPYLNEWSV